MYRPTCLRRINQHNKLQCICLKWDVGLYVSVEACNLKVSKAKINLAFLSSGSVVQDIKSVAGKLNYLNENQVKQS